ERIRPDGVILGKALGGGVLPVSAFAGTRALMDVFTPGSHGSTFGGNPLAAAVGLEALRVLEEEGLVERSRVLGEHMLQRLKRIKSPVLKDVRGRGLWAGAEIAARFGDARAACERLLAKGVLSKETHDTVIRLAPPLMIAREDLDWALDRFEEVVRELEPLGRKAAWPRLRQGEPSMTSVAPRILMCRPKHFAVTYAINPWMDPAGWAADGRSLTASARLEWERLHHALLGLGATVELLPPVPDLPDLVFTANAAVVMDRKALLARFRHAERRREQPYFERGFRELKARGYIDSIVPLPEDIVLEGAGDCVWDATRRLFWMGHGPRSALAARDVVEEAFGVETLALELADPRFYHMDTALSALSKGDVMYFP